MAHLCVFSERPDCSEDNLCSFCIKRQKEKALDELAQETQELEKLFSTEEREFESTWKTTKFWICQTDSMSLWIGINSVTLKILFREDGDGRPTREEYKEIVKSFPYEVGNCRCRDCRYFRFTKSKN